MSDQQEEKRHGGQRENTGRPPLPKGEKRIPLQITLSPKTLELLRARFGTRRGAVAIGIRLIVEEIMAPGRHTTAVYIRRSQKPIRAQTEQTETDE